MKLIIAGSRDMHVSNNFINSLIQLYNLKSIREVISGACGIDNNNKERSRYKAKGIDGCGENWAVENNIPVKRYYAKWDELGRKAGPVRNEEMAQNGHALMLIWDGKSRGSSNMKFSALRAGIEIYECILRQDNVKSYKRNHLTE